ncbi:mucin-3A-like [Stigmatopora argus]
MESEATSGTGETTFRPSTEALETTEGPGTTFRPSTEALETTEGPGTTIMESSTGTPESHKTTNPASTGTPESHKTTNPGSTATTETSNIPSTGTPETDRTTTPKGQFHCQNGGTSTATGCLCASGFQGQYCQFLEESVEIGEIESLVKIDVVLDKRYESYLDNTTSEAYKKFVKDFEEEMTGFYLETRLKHFEKVVVTNVSRGRAQGLVKRSLSAVEKLRLESDATAFRKVTLRQQGVNVSHDVVLSVPNNDAFEKEYKHDYDIIMEALKTVDDPNTDFPYNVTQEPSVAATNVSFETFCASQIEDSVTASHYKAVRNNSVLVCVSRCSPLYDAGRLVCHNHGVCKVYRDVGAVCQCRDLESTWYLGKDCSLPIQQTPFYVSLALTLACLVAAVAGLSAYVVSNKKVQKRKKDMKNLQVNQWFNSEFEWSRAGRSSTEPFDTGHANPSFCHDSPSPPPRRRADSRRSSSSVFTLDGTELSMDTSLMPPFEEIRIQRPQIRSSGDV